MNTIGSKSSSITFYRSLGMRNHIETQKERSQGTSIQQKSMHYLPRRGFLGSEGGGGGVVQETIVRTQRNRRFHKDEKSFIFGILEKRGLHEKILET